MLPDIDISPICAFRPCGKIELDGGTVKEQHKSSFEEMSFKMPFRKIKREALAFDSLLFLLVALFISFLSGVQKNPFV